MFPRLTQCNGSIIRETPHSIPCQTIVHSEWAFFLTLRHADLRPLSDQMVVTSDFSPTVQTSSFNWRLNRDQQTLMR